MSEHERCEGCGSNKVVGRTLDDVALCPLCAPGCTAGWLIEWYDGEWHDGGFVRQRPSWPDTERRRAVRLVRVAPASGEPSGAEAAVREALDALASLFKQVLYVRERDTHGAWLPDWACAECRPDSDLIEDGFRCGFHAAKAVLSANDRLPTAPGENELAAEAVVREAPPISDTAVARIIEAVETHCGMGHGAWDMVSARDLVEGFAAVFRERRNG